MTDTNTLAPTDAEIFALEVAHTKRHETRDCTGYFSEFDIVAFTLSAIAKWGAPALASQPFAYEFSRSNGDGTHSEHIESGRLQEVAPGRWEHSGLPRGALADKPIKALYTTPQTQPAAVPAGMEPVAHVSQETFNDDGTSDIIIPALPIGMALYAAPQPAAQALDAQRLTKASKDISTVLRVEGMDLEIGSRKLLREARDAIDAAIAAQKGGAA